MNKQVSGYFWLVILLLIIWLVPLQAQSTPAITGLSVYNADTDIFIETLEQGDILNVAAIGTDHLAIVAIVSGSVESVTFSLNTDPLVIENTAPYVYPGDFSGDYEVWIASVGMHQLDVIPYTADFGTGTAGITVSVQFEIVNNPITATATPTATNTLPPTATPTATATNTLPPTATPTATATNTLPPSATPTATATADPNFPTITDLSVYNADTDTFIETLEQGDILNIATIGTDHLAIVANVSGLVESVTFLLNTDPLVIENNAPYVYPGDFSGDYEVWVAPPGMHQLDVIPYTADSGAGTAGTTVSVQFEIVNNPVTATPTDTLTPTATPIPVYDARLYIIGWGLFNAQTNTFIRWIDNNETINLATIGTTEINIEAVVSCPTLINSVDFNLDLEPFWIENVLPFYFAGDDTLGDIFQWTPAPTIGTHTISALPYTQAWATGDYGTASSITFEIIDNLALPQATPQAVAPTVTPDCGTVATPTMTATATLTPIPPTPTITPTGTPASAQASYRINVGGLTLPDPEGILDWARDDTTLPSPYLSAGGEGTSYTTNVINTGDASLPANVPMELFQSERWDSASVGEMTYDFPVATGLYEVRIYLAEIYGGITTAGQRIFDAEVEGIIPAQFNDIDPFAFVGYEAGYMLSYQVSVSDGNLNLRFLHNVENPAVKGIEILLISTPQATATPTMTATATITATPPNIAPIVDLTSANVTYTVRTTAITVLNSVTITDPGGAIQSATIKIDNLIDTNFETIAVTVTGAIIADTSVAGVITLTGNGTPAEYAQVIASLSYQNTSTTPNIISRDIEVVVTDDTGLSSIPQIVRVYLDEVTEAPVVKLNIGGGADEINYNTTYSEGSLPILAVGIVDISDADSSNLSGMTVTILNSFPDDMLEVTTGTVDITSFYFYDSVTKRSMLTLAGYETIDNYKVVLQTLVYENLSDDPDGGDRILEVIVDDGENRSLPTTSTISITTTNTAPSVNLDADNIARIAPDYTINLVDWENARITNRVTIIDPENDQLTSAIITLTNNLDGNAEVLAIPPDILIGTNISPDYIAGVLTLSGIASTDTYATVIQNLTYSNTDSDPDLTQARVVEVIVTDAAGLDSTPVTTSFTLPGASSDISCINWQLGNNGSWQDSNPGSVTWDAQGMYSNGTIPTVEVTYTLSGTGPWLIHVNSNESDSFTLLAGATIADTVVVPRSNGSYYVEHNNIALQWSSISLIFQSICYTPQESVDLTVSYLDTDPVDVDFDSLEISGTFTANISNSGTGDIDDPFKVIFFDDTNNDGAYDPGDTILGQSVQSGMTAGQTRTVTADASGVIQFAGDLVYVYVDSNNQIAEFNEDNNLFRAQCGTGE